VVRIRFSKETLRGPSGISKVEILRLSLLDRFRMTRRFSRGPGELQQWECGLKKTSGKCNQQAHIAYVIAGRSGNNGVAKRCKKSEGVASAEKILGI